MLTLDDLDPVLIVAIDARLRKGSRPLAHVLAANGWIESSTVVTDGSRERSWSHSGPLDEGSSNGSAWMTERREGADLGLIIRATSDTAARELHDAIRDRIASEPRLVSGDPDDVWSNWSDGQLTISLAMYQGSALDGKPVAPCVQLGFEMADAAERTD